MTTRLTPEREREVREAHERLRSPRVSGATNDHGDFIRDDVPPLLAEIDALRNERDEAQERALAFWNEVNTRRHALIAKSEETPLFPEEDRELERLQSLADLWSRPFMQEAMARLDFARNGAES